MQTYLGSYFVNQFNQFGRTWRVYVQADPRYRMKPDSLNSIYVRGRSTNQSSGATSVLDGMIPLSTVVSTRSTAGPSTYSRYNMYNTAELTGSASPGYSSGDVIKVMEDLLKQMPEGIGYEWTGTAFQEKESGGKQIQIFALALIFVFLVLAALYESWAIPFSVLLGVPLGVFGAFLGIRLMHLNNDVYVQIGLVMLIGLAAKNAILIVEFAKMEHDAGKPLIESALGSAKLRFRPILMTAFAFILGVVPLLTASGAGAEARKVMGMAVFSGMLIATILGVCLIPMLFVAVEKLTGGAKAHEAKASPAPAVAAGIAHGSH
jgi:multidrug efflux pump subunit AcrB